MTTARKSPPKITKSEIGAPLMIPTMSKIASLRKRAESARPG
jgi:hypothetical protein